MNRLFLSIVLCGVLCTTQAWGFTVSGGGGGTADTITAVDNFTNSDSTTVQGVLEDLDGSIAGGGTTLVDIVTTAPLLINGTTNVDNALPGADADVTFSIPAATNAVDGYMTSTQVTALEAVDTEAELEALLELQDLQGAVTDAQVPNTITIDSATAATTATVATTVTITDNESTAETNAIVFTSGGDVDGGDIGLESDGDLTYNPSTGDLGVGGSVVVGGDLTVTGDDITLTTNTDKAILVADGTNFNPVVPSGDVDVTNTGVFSVSDFTLASEATGTLTQYTGAGWEILAPGTDGKFLMSNGPGVAVSYEVPPASGVSFTPNGSIAATDVQLAIQEVRDEASGYTNLTSFVNQTPWTVYYANAAGDVIELGLGGDGSYLMSNGAAVAPTFEVPAGGGDALVANGLDQFAATTSAEFATVISDPNGTGAVSFSTSPAFVTPTLGVASATSVDIGNADTTIARSSAGVITVEGNHLVPSTTTIVPIGGDINTYITAATAGDTLELSAGTYTITSAINVSKQLNIKGQGNAGLYSVGVTDVHGTRIYCATDNVAMFNITASNVRLADMSLHHAGAGAGIGAVGIVTATDLSGLTFDSIDVVMPSGAGIKTGIDILGSNTILRDVTFYLTSTNASAYGVYVHNDNTTGIDAIVDVHTTSGTVDAGSTRASPYYVYNNNDANTITMNLFASWGDALSGTANDVAAYANSTTTNNAILNVYESTLKGADYDIQQAGTNTVNFFGGILVNGTSDGTITQIGSVRSGNLAATTYGSDGTVTDAELLFINTLSSNAQTQIDAKQTADADLTTWAGITPSANVQSFVSAANYAAMVGLIDDSDFTFTGVIDAGGATSFELPNSATPTTNALGEMALDTTITDHDALLQYYDGSKNLSVIAVPTSALPATDDYIIRYDAVSDSFGFEASTDTGITELVEDTTPVLGGNLDVDTFNIEGVDATEFSYLDGVASDIQTQIDAKVSNVPTVLSLGTVNTTTVSIVSDGSTPADDVTLPAAVANTSAGVMTAAQAQAIVDNTAKDTNVSTALSTGTVTSTTYGITSDGGADDIVLAASTTDYAGLMTAAQFDALAAVDTPAEVAAIIDGEDIQPASITMVGTADGGQVLYLLEDTDNGTSYVGIGSPASNTNASSLILMLPTADPTGQFIQCAAPSSVTFADGVSRNASACTWTSSGGGDLLANGTVPLTANWDVGSYTITAPRFISDIATGTAPFVVTSTTTVTNLNADTVDGQHASYFEVGDAAITKSDEVETLSENWVNTAHPWAVNEGGTGAATFTDGGILLGSGTGAITALGVATNGQIPIGDGTTDPVLSTLTGTANEVTVTNGAGTITLSIPDSPVLVTPALGAATADSLIATGIVRGRALFLSYSAAQTLTAATHNGGLVQMTTADEVTMWDCETANVGDFVGLWARDAEKIEVVPASGDHFNLFDGTALTADYELDMAATAGTKVTLLCTADDTWSVYTETAACTDGGVAD